MTSPMTAFDAALIGRASAQHSDTAAEIKQAITALGDQVEQCQLKSSNDMTTALVAVYNQFVESMTSGKGAVPDLQQMSQDMLAALAGQQHAGESNTALVKSAGSDLHSHLS